MVECGRKSCTASSSQLPKAPAMLMVVVFLLEITLQITLGFPTAQPAVCCHYHYKVYQYFSVSIA
jgi:hypothetical protein